MEPSFDPMTTAERILYVQDLWDRIASDTNGLPLSVTQAAELDRRLAAYQGRPDDSIP